MTIEVLRIFFTGLAGLALVLAGIGAVSKDVPCSVGAVIVAAVSFAGNLSLLLVVLLAR